MTKKKHTTHGIAVTDAKVAPPYRKATSDSGWTVRRFQPHHWRFTDSDIAKKYGQGKTILITEDKTAHTENVKNGFAGYVYLDSTVKKEEESEYLIKYKNIMSKVTRNDIEGHCLYISKNKTYEKTKIYIKKSTSVTTNDKK